MLVSTISTALITILFLSIFRSLASLVQVFTMLAIVILSSILITHWFFGYVHAMTIAIGSTLVGICIDYPIHAIAHARVGEKQQRLKIIARIWPSMLLGGGTTLVGYAALGFSGYPGFQQIALYAGSGIILAVVLTRFVLPQLMTGRQHSEIKVPFAVNWFRFGVRYRPFLKLVIGVFVLISLYAFKSLHWLEDMQALTPELNYLKENDQRIRSRMVSIEPGRFILITGPDSETALQNAERVYPILDELKRQGALKDYIGLYPWLLSAKQQQHNLQWLEQLLSDEKRLLWKQALIQQGLSVKHLGELNYSDTQPITLDQILKTPAKRLLDNRIMTAENQTLLILWLSEHEPDVIKRALEGQDYARYFSQRDLLNNMTNAYTERAKKLLLSGLLVIVIILTLHFGSLKKSLQTLSPALISAMMILGFWALSGIAISFLHVVGFLLVVAICVDYGIFYQENRSGHLERTYQAMAASMLTSALAFGSLMVAESTSLKILATVVAFGVIVGFLLCPVLIRHRR